MTYSRWKAGLVLFAMILGAGNMLYPAEVGSNMGERWLPGLIGFQSTAVLIPLVILTALFVQPLPFDKLATTALRIPHSGAILLVIIILCLGPLAAVPRLGALFYQLGFKELIGDGFFLHGLETLFFFSLVGWLAYCRASIVGRISRFIVPLLCIFLLAMLLSLGTGSLEIPRTHIPTWQDAPAVIAGAIKGLTTFDGIAVVLIAAVIGEDLARRRLSANMAMQGALLTALLLVLFYAGMTILGAADPGAESTSPARMARLFERHLGAHGRLSLALFSLVACITPAVALISAGASYLHESCFRRVSYGKLVIFLTVASIPISLVQVDQISAAASIAMAGIYPLVLYVALYGLVARWHDRSSAQHEARARARQQPEWFC